MQPQNNPHASFNLPPVAAEQLPQIVPNEAAPGLPEVPTAQPEYGPAPQPANPGVAMPLMPQMSPLQPALPIMPVVPQATPTGVPITTDETDLIEKEWVNKAKQIVAKTHDDPYLQSRELSGLKADYLNKRYSKEIKLGE